MPFELLERRNSLYYFTQYRELLKRLTGVWQRFSAKWAILLNTMASATSVAGQIVKYGTCSELLVFQTYCFFVKRGRSLILLRRIPQLALEHVSDRTLRQPRDNPLPRPKEHPQRPGRNLSSPQTHYRSNPFANELHDESDLRLRDSRSFPRRNRLQHVF